MISYSASEDVALQSSDNKLSRATEPLDPEAVEVVRSAYAEYRKLVDRSIARELVRNDLPLSLYTE